MRNFMILACLILAVAVGLFFYMNWLHVSTVRGDKGESGVKLTFDKNKAKADIDAAKEKGKEQAKAAKEKLTGNEEVKGAIKTVDTDKKQVTIARTGEADMTVDIAQDTKILVGSKEGKMEDLRAGQEATCVFQTKAGKNECSLLTVKTAR